jgi:polyisoprenoid-binding protein YceI
LIKSHFHKALALLIFIFPLISHAAYNWNWKIIPEKSTLTFTAIQNNSPVTGQFKTFTTQIYFDPANLKTNHIQVNIDMNSIAASYDEVENTLKTDDWFNIKLFPEASFKTTSITQMGNNSYQANGTLTIRDKTIPITFPFTLIIKDKKAQAIGSVTLKRTLFGIGQHDWTKTDIIKDDVKVTFNISAEQFQ